AAGEMRQRLMDWLAEFARADDARLREELRARGVDAAHVDALIVPLRGLHLRLLRQGRGVQIRTFHSWFAALLRNAPLAVLDELGLPAAYELLESDEEARAQVWRPFHARLLREQEEGGTALMDYQAVVAAHGRSQTEKALDAALDKRVEFALADADRDAQGASVLERSVPRFESLYPEFAVAEGAQPLDVLLSPGELRDGLGEAARLLGQATQPSFRDKGVALETALSARVPQAVLEALLTEGGRGTPRKFSDKVAGIERVREVQQVMLRVLQAQQQHEAWLHQQRMARLARLLLEEYATLKRQRGWVDMSDVERAALHLLERSELSAWLQQRLDARTRHLLIDEFQDTNPLQWQALHAWLSGYAGAGGGATGGGGAPRLFIVGDPKQSIYRFRRAEPQIFRAAQDFVQALGGDLLACDHTRRNASAVLTHVNTVLGEAQARGEYEGFRAHTTESVQAGEVAML
ncbi:UvrD-helicase domain-containing protein, partial [Leptospira sp. 96542]|nr:UvrD-helicase domain-containing protein [Leptospira sp. 96542]